MKKLIFAIIFIMLIIGEAFCGDVGESNYRDALKYIEEGNLDFAFMEFRRLIQDYPDSKWAKESLFGIGEYLYHQRCYAKALVNFLEFIDKYPQDKAAVFAKAYVFKIYSTVGVSLNDELWDKIKKDLCSQPIFLAFSDYRFSSYTSPLGNEFEVREFLDKLNIYRNGEIFYEIKP